MPGGKWLLVGEITQPLVTPSPSLWPNTEEVNEMSSGPQSYPQVWT